MHIGDKLEDFQSEKNEGRDFSPIDMIDKYAFLVIFISSECELSMSYLGRICKLIDKYEEDDLGVLLIDVSHIGESFDKLLDCLIEKNIKIKDNPDLKLVKDPGLALVTQFGATVTPEAFLFSRDRELIYHGAIDDAGDNPAHVTRVYLEDAIEYALDGLEIDYPEVEAYGTPIHSIDDMNNLTGK